MKENTPTPTSAATNSTRLVKTPSCGPVSTDHIDTPIVAFETQTTSVLAKLEQCNPSGSHKDRPARLIIEALFRSGRLSPDARLLVSSSGNFARAIAYWTASSGVLVEVYTDVLSSAGQISSLWAFPHVRVNVIDEPDATGSHLKARLRLIAEAQSRDPKAVFIDQYQNFLLPLAYEQTLAQEIEEQTRGDVSAVFVVVGTGATLNGILQYKIQHAARWRVIAVDAAGSALFHVPPSGTKRRLPGYGNGLRTGLVKALPAGLDYVVHVTDWDVVMACHEMRRIGLNVGPSSGAIVAAVDYVAQFRPELLGGYGRPLLIMPDGGEHYEDTVYSPEWLCSKGLGGMTSCSGVR